MRIVMIGTGYVGLVSGVCLADFGHEVICVDNDGAKIEMLNSGEVPIFEPNLKSLINKNVNASRLKFTTDLKESMRGANVVFIAVGTPSRRGDGHADLSYVYAATNEISKNISKFTVIATKSTVPVGTGDEIEKILSKNHSKDKFSVVSNPEFLREGAAIKDFKHPDRIIVGAECPDAIEIMKAVYRPLFINETPILFTNRRTSELIKYASNSFLATKISFINEMANLCENVGADVQALARGMGLDKRIAPKFLHAGPGYGGSCFPKDTTALIRTAEEAEVSLPIIQSVIKSNEDRKHKMVQKIIRFFNGDLNNKTLAFLGLAFKPNTDDMRDAASLTIIPELQNFGALIKVYDPASMKEAKNLLQNIDYKKNSYDCIEGADALIILTEWDEFRALDMVRVKKSLRSPNIIDLRNIYNPQSMQEYGFNYISVGR
ncbi:MAG: UDP-glucose/GDP-mannose dehydrogenase family protein [Hellea sp.]|nr:UDP-glucose/GDP-mannose dehydrogenase family protein [Hellea sp.]